MPTLQELESAFLSADAQGNIEDAQVFATEIKKLRAEPQQPMSPLGMGAASQKAELEAAASDPSIMGSFARNARENLGAGVGGALAGAASGAATGAGLGAMGFNPLTVGIGAIGGGLIGGVAGAFGGQKIQGVIDPITEERQLALARDMEVNPISSFAGQIAPALITGKFSPGNIGRAITPLGRATDAAERAAIINSRINVGTEIGVGGAFDIGQSLATGQPMDPRQIALNAATGALFSDPNRLGRALGQPGPMAISPAPEVIQPTAPVQIEPAPTIIPQQGPLVPITPAPPLVATGATRLAGDLAAPLGIDPLTLTPSGADATVTPNDVRAAAANIPAITSDSGGTIDITPARKPDPTITDLIDSNITWEGQAGKLVDDEGRPALLLSDGSFVELPFSYATDRSLTDLGVQPTYDRQQDRATATRFFGETENESLQSVFNTIDNNTDDLLDIAELGVSLKKQKGKKSIPVHDTPEFAPQLRSITDEQILVAEEQIKKAISQAETNPNLSDETRTAVINKLSGDLENISAITAARDSGKYQRLPFPVSSPEVPSQRASLAATDAIADSRAAGRILNNEPPLTAEATAAPVSRKLTLGPEETGIAPVATENAVALPVTPELIEAPAAPAPAPRQLSARTRAKKLGTEIGDLGKQIMSQRQKISELKKNGLPKQTITKAEKQLATLKETQSQKKQERATANSEIPKVYKGLSKAASTIRSAVSDNIENFPGLNSVGLSKIKMPPPQLALILGKRNKGITLSSKEINFLEKYNGRGEYDGYIKISDIDSMPGTPEGREAAKHILRSIYAKYDDYAASSPDTVSKDTNILWSDLESDLSDIAKGKSRSYEDEYDAYMAEQEAQFLEKENAKAQPVSEMDMRNQDSRELFADDGGFALASEKTQDGSKIVAERNAKEEAAIAQDEAQGKFFDETPEPETYDFVPTDNEPFSRTEAPARTADMAGIEKAADDFFGGSRPDNVKVVNELNANWEARLNGDTIELNAAKLGPEGVRSALNEEVGHVAFRNEKDKATFQKLYDGLDESTRTKVNDTVDKLYSDASPSLKAEEKLVKALRSILDRTPEGRTFWQKLLQIARRTYKTLTGQATKDPEMIAAALLRRGIGAVKKGTPGDNRFSATKSKITPEQVAEHRAAVERGDMETAQRLAIGAAKAAGYNRKGVRFGFYVNGVPLPPSRNTDLNFGPGYYVAEGANLDTTTSSSVSVSPTANPKDLQRLGLRPEDVEFRRDTVFVKAEKPLRNEYGGNYDKETADFINAQLAYDSAVQEARRTVGMDSEQTSWGKTVSDLIASGKLPFDSIRGMTGRQGMSSELVVQHPSQIKSAEAATYDNDGKLIPLDERFRDTSDDIRYSNVGNTTPADAYRKALDTAKQEVADRADYKAQAKNVKAEIAKLPKAEQKPATVRMYAELDEARIIGKGKDQQFKVEMPKVVQEIIASGKEPTEADILASLTKKFPEQKGYLQKNFDRLVSDMMFAEELAMSGDNGDWTGYGKRLTEHFAEISEGVKVGSTIRHIQRGLSLFRNTYFNGIGGKMQALAEGKITGKNSAAGKEYSAKIMGVRASQDGVNFEGVDGLSEVDVKRMNNERIKFDTDLNAYFKKEGMSDEAQAAWLERVSDHVVTPSRDAELAKDPKLKEAVDYFIKRRRERLAYLREAGVDVGDAGERSLSRSINTEKVLSNPKEFLDKAKRAYMRKWAREISNLRNEEAIKAAEGKDTTSIKEKIRDLEKMDAQEAAEKYLYAITSNNDGISSDGNDITAASGGGQPAFLKKREFGPEADELLGKFYHRNIAAMDTAETLASVRAATKARVLSAPALDAQGNPRKDGKINPVGGWEEFRSKLEAEGNEDQIPIWAQLTKDYLNLNGSNNETARKLVGNLHTYTQLAYLSHATVASLGEPAMIGARTGKITDTGRAYTQIAKGIVRALIKAEPDEIRILNRELGLVADSFDGMMSGHALGDSFGGRGKGGGLVTNFHRLTGLSGWTNLTFDAATKIGKSFISSQVKLAKAGGSMSTLAKRELNELGMSMKDIDVMDTFIAKLDKEVDQNSMILGDEPGANLYRKAIAMFHKTGAALNPTRGTRAQKANSPIAGMFYQLQSFLYDFHQKFTLRQTRRLKDAYRGTVEIDGATEKLSARERSQVAIDAAKAVAAIYGLQYGIQILREQLFVDPERSKRDKKKTQGEVNMARALGAASRTGILGPYDTLFNIVSGARYQREPATVVLGPAVGGMSELFQSVVSLYGERNSGNTNTAERKLARTAYNTTVTPALNAVFAGMPAGPLSAALVQAFRHPLTREGAVSTVAGPIQSQKKGPMKTTKYY